MKKQYLLQKVGAVCDRPYLDQQLNWIFETTKEKIYAYTRLAKWHEQVERSGTVFCFLKGNGVHQNSLIGYLIGPAL